MKLVIWIFSTFFSISAFCDCDLWFSKTGIKPGSKDCEIKCVVAKVGMNSFMCHDQCDKLCKTVISMDVLDKYISSNTLLQAEKNAVAKYPKDALMVYRAKIEAENSTDKMFGTGRHNDESDAFRHFMWSSLMTKEIGSERARIFTTAHEDWPKNPKDEKDMDLSNNETGIKAAEEFKKQEQLTKEKLEKYGLELLREKKLRVLTPRGQVPEWRE